MKKFILAIVAMSVFTTAQASFLIEPYLGTHISSDVDNGTSKDFGGVGMGARLGWQNLGLQLGVNYKMATLDVDDRGDADYNHIGVFAGYEFPILVRAWAEYVLSSDVDFDNGSEMSGASGTTIGFGYTGLPFVAINFETTKITYDDNSSNRDDEINSYMLSISLPFTF